MCPEDDSRPPLVLEQCDERNGALLRDPADVYHADHRVCGRLLALQNSSEARRSLPLFASGKYGLQGQVPLAIGQIMLDKEASYRGSFHKRESPGLGKPGLNGQKAGIGGVRGCLRSEFMLMVAAPSAPPHSIAKGRLAPSAGRPRDPRRRIAPPQSALPSGRV